MQSCEDRARQWLYPIAPYNVGYDPILQHVRPDAFPSQYLALDKVLGKMLEQVDQSTYLFIVSDHGIKPLCEFEETDQHSHMDHEKTTPVIQSATLSTAITSRAPLSPWGLASSTTCD